MQMKCKTTACRILHRFKNTSSNRRREGKDLLRTTSVTDDGFLHLTALRDQFQNKRSAAKPAPYSQLCTHIRPHSSNQLECLPNGLSLFLFSPGCNGLSDCSTKFSGDSNAPCNLSSSLPFVGSFVLMWPSIL